MDHAAAGMKGGGARAGDCKKVTRQHAGRATTGGKKEKKKAQRHQRHAANQTKVFTQKIQMKDF